MGGVGAIAGVVFGVIWTFAAASMGAPVFFPLFGIVFIIIGIAQAVYHFKNAVGEKRYSAFDITDEREEADPLNERFGQQKMEQDPDDTEKGGNFCPYCGAKIHPDYEFCRQCGKKL
jgi:xanthosine utilization system XapX-like protein